MEKYIKYSLFAVLTFFIVSSCEKGNTKFPETPTGALVYITKDATTGTAIDFNDLANVNLNFDVTIMYGNVSSVDIVCVKDNDWVNNSVTYASGISPGAVNITPQKLIDAFADLTDLGDFFLGQEFFFYPIVTTAEGLILPLWEWDDVDSSARANYGAAIAQEPDASLELTYVVDCPFDRSIFPGTYDNPTGGFTTTTVEEDPAVTNGLIIREFWWGGGVESLRLVLHDDGTITGDDQLVADVDAFGFGAVWARGITGGLVTNNCVPVFQFSASMDLPEGGLTWGVQTFILTRTGAKGYTVSRPSERFLPTLELD